MSYKYCVIVPTCMLPHVAENFEGWIKYGSDDTVIVLSVNPIDKEQASHDLAYIRSIFPHLKQRYNHKNFELDFIEADGPIGFGEAFNRAYEYASEKYEITESYIVFNDDIEATPEWQEKLVMGLYADFYSTGRLLSYSKKVDRSMFPVKIGMAGPMSDNVGGIQSIRMQSEDYIDFSKMVSEKYKETYVFQSFISGFCVAFTPEFLSETMINDGFIFDPVFKIGGFEDDDLCVRALHRGYMPVVVKDCWLKHNLSKTINTFDNVFSGVHNHSVYLKKWEKYTQREQKLVSAYRVAIRNVNALLQLKSSLIRSIPFVDGISFLLTSNPAECLESYDSAMFPNLTPRDQNFIKSCLDIKSKDDLIDITEKWISDIFSHPQVNKKVELKVELWDKPFNERDERNRNYEMAVEMDADWVISIDADEVIEDRVKVEDLRRLMKNPNPIKSSYHFGWLNHYETPSLVRTDKPFANGYLHSMSGSRMWRVWNNKHFPIFSGSSIGLHCGNSPDYGVKSQDIASIRFRHLAMIREVDRFQKTAFYNEIDKERDAKLVGNSDYSHASKSENVSMDMYNPNNGIGSFTMGYGKEIVCAITQKFKTFFSFSDKIVFVWTDEWSEEDKSWLDIPLESFPSKDEWSFTTGPNWDLAYASKIYGVYVVHRNLDDKEGLAGCRNAAIEKLRTLNDGRMRWVFYLDPDEMHYGVPEMMAYCSVRKMAESPSATAFIFNFVNPVKLRDGTIFNSKSQSMRLFMMHEALDLKFQNVVHETIEKSLRAASSKGIKISVKNCPIEWSNAGLMSSPEEVGRKLMKYQKGLIDNIKQNPKNSSSWMSLGLTYLNDGDEMNAQKCLERACILANGAFMPYRELAFLFIRRAKELLWQSYNLCKNDPQNAKPIEEIGSFIKAKIGDFPQVDDGGFNVSSHFELPDFNYNMSEEGIEDAESPKEIDG